MFINWLRGVPEPWGGIHLFYTKSIRNDYLHRKSAALYTLFILYYNTRSDSFKVKFGCCEEEETVNDQVTATNRDRSRIQLVRIVTLVEVARVTNHYRKGAKQLIMTKPLLMTAKTLLMCRGSEFIGGVRRPRHY